MPAITIIGTGLAGYNLAREFRKLDKSSSLTLISADSGHYYSKPQLSTALTQNKSAKDLAIFTAHAMSEQLNAQIHTYSAVTAINTNEKTLTLNHSKTLSYDKLVIAWGAETIDAKLPGEKIDNIFSINDLASYDTFRAALKDKQKVAILGSGLVGCEFSNDLINAGIEIDNISLATTPLDTLIPKKAGQILADSLTRKGLRWHWQSTITNIEQTSNGQLAIELSNGTKLMSDLLISAIGLKPHTLLAEQSGLTVNRGIVVDQMLRTSDENIYALGDCAEVCGYVHQYVQPINHAARALAKTLANIPTPVSYPPMPVSIKTPACPIVTSPPPRETTGSWDIEQAGAHIKAMFLDKAGAILGFTLTGDRVKERLELTTLLPPMLSNN